MRTFQRADDGVVTAEIERDEALLLQSLGSQLAAVLTEADGADPAMARLLPDAYPDDAVASAEFRRFTSAGLVSRKLLNVERVLVTLSASVESGVLSLDGDDAQSWLRTLTDLRLTLASRLGIESDESDHRAEGDDAVLHDLYDWLGFVQNSLVEAIDA